MVYGKMPVRYFASRKDWDENVDYYEALLVKKTATSKEIKLAYYKMC